jgi:hypothetical protein
MLHFVVVANWCPGINLLHRVKRMNKKEGEMFKILPHTVGTHIGEMAFLWWQFLS